MHRTAVTRGDNTGMTLTGFNIVREMRGIGEWRGAEEEIPLGLGLDATEYDGCAIIVQASTGGPILGALAVPMADWRRQVDQPETSE